MNLRNISFVIPNREDSEQTLCCVTLVCLAPASAIVGAVECTMTLTAAPIPGIIELGFDVTDSITVLVWSLRHVYCKLLVP